MQPADARRQNPRHPEPAPPRPDAPGRRGRPGSGRAIRAAGRAHPGGHRTVPARPARGSTATPRRRSRMIEETGTLAQDQKQALRAALQAYAASLNRPRGMTGRLAEMNARIAGIRQLGSVVNAMRGIAGARAQQARGQLDAVDSYTQTIASAIGRVLSLAPPVQADGPGSARPERGCAVLRRTGFCGRLQRACAGPGRSLTSRFFSSARAARKFPPSAGSRPVGAARCPPPPPAFPPLPNISPPPSTSALRRRKSTVLMRCMPVFIQPKLSMWSSAGYSRSTRLRFRQRPGRTRRSSTSRHASCSAK